MTADIKVFSTHAVMEVLNVLGPRFETSTDHRLSLHYDPANALKRQIEDGAVFDVLIATQDVIGSLAECEKIVINTCEDIALSGLGVAVREGSPKPDISTTEAFKQTMLAARSVVRSSEGTSGVYFEKLLDRLGIAQDMHDRIILGPSGRIAELVARGEAEIAVQQISELLPVTGTEFVGPFPPQLQLYTTFSAGVSVAAKDQDGAKAFIKSLRAPAAGLLFKAKGLEQAP